MIMSVARSLTNESELVDGRRFPSFEHAEHEVLHRPLQRGETARSARRRATGRVRGDQLQVTEPLRNPGWIRGCILRAPLACANLNAKAVGVEEECGVVPDVVLRERLWRVEDARTGAPGKCVSALDVEAVFNGECDVVEARRIKLKRLSCFGTRGFAKSDRAASGLREAQVVKCFATLALEDDGRLQAQRAEDVEVEADRSVDVDADKVDVRKSGEHRRRR
jgi:hypothetical protein